MSQIYLFTTAKGYDMVKMTWRNLIKMTHFPIITRFIIASLDSDILCAGESSLKVRLKYCFQYK